MKEYRMGNGSIQAVCSILRTKLFRNTIFHTDIKLLPTDSLISFFLYFIFFFHFNSLFAVATAAATTTFLLLFMRTAFYLINFISFVSLSVLSVS